MPSSLFSIWLTPLSPFFTDSLPFLSKWENETFWVKCGLNADHFNSLVRMRTKSAIADFYGSTASIAHLVKSIFHLWLKSILEGLAHNHLSSINALLDCLTLRVIRRHVVWAIKHSFLGRWQNRGPGSFSTMTIVACMWKRKRKQEETLVFGRITGEISRALVFSNLLYVVNVVFVNWKYCILQPILWLMLMNIENGTRF